VSFLSVFKLCTLSASLELANSGIPSHSDVLYSTYVHCSPSVHAGKYNSELSSMKSSQNCWGCGDASLIYGSTFTHTLVQSFLSPSHNEVIVNRPLALQILYYCSNPLSSLTSRSRGVMWSGSVDKFILSLWSRSGKATALDSSIVVSMKFSLQALPVFTLVWTGQSDVY
jgi:hypothetical protein